MKGRRPGSRIRTALRQELASGDLRAGEYLPPLRELSKKYDVTRKTITRALKMLEDEGLVCMEPRRGCRILATANDPAHGCPIAFINGINLEWEVSQGRYKPYQNSHLILQKVASKRGWSVLGIDGRNRNHEFIMHQLRAARVCGVVVSSVSLNLVREFKNYGLPIVVIDSWFEEEAVDTIIQDNFQGGMLAARHPLSHGHERIAWMGSRRDTSHSMARYSGALMELRRQGGSIPDEFDFECDKHSAVEVGKTILQKKNRPRAILALWLNIAIGLVKAARELGMEPGVDFDMVGWTSGEEYERDYTPTFTGFRVQPAIFWDPMEMAEQAVDRLESQRRVSNLPPVRVSVPTVLRMPGAGS